MISFVNGGSYTCPPGCVQSTTGAEQDAAAEQATVPVPGGAVQPFRVVHACAMATPRSYCTLRSARPWMMIAGFAAAGQQLIEPATIANPAMSLDRSHESRLGSMAP